MPIKNYTTTISAMKSIGEIQGILVAHGAKAIQIEYGDDREPCSLSFIIPTPQGGLSFRLPANIKAMEKVLLQQGAKDRYPKSQSSHASRVGWRILKDWVDAQCAIIETEMVKIEQVFLPYMQVKGQQTLYEAMLDKGFYLEEGKG